MKNKWKIVLILILALSLLGCSNDNVNLKGENTNNSADDKNQHDSQDNIVVNPNAIDLREYISFNYEGDVGRAEAELVVNEEALNKLIPQEEMDEYLDYLAFDEIFPGEEFTLSDFLEFRIISQPFALDNGDIIEVEVDTVEQYTIGGETDIETLQRHFGVFFETLVLEFVVEGIEEYKKIDFISLIDEYIYFTYDGERLWARLDIPDGFEVNSEIFKIIYDKDYDGSGGFEVYYEGERIEIFKLNFKSNVDVLKPGDEILLTYSLNAGNALFDYGYKYDLSEKKIVVPDIPDIFYEPDEISDELKVEIKKAFEEYIGSRLFAYIIEGDKKYYLYETSSKTMWGEPYNHTAVMCCFNAKYYDDVFVIETGRIYPIVYALNPSKIIYDIEIKQSYVDYDNIRMNKDKLVPIEIE